MDRLQRLKLVDPNAVLSIRHQCDLLNLPRGGYYYKPKAISALNAYLMKLIDMQYQRTPFYGVPRMTDYLNHACGFAVNKKRVERLYRLMDIRALGPNPYTSKKDPSHNKYPYLLRELDITAPNQIWAADITYIGMKYGYMYLFAIIDLYSRYIIAWDIANSMTSEWCQYVVKQALEYYPTPEIFNTDQGAQFTADKFVALIYDNGIRMSMDGKGRAIDNIFIERFWRSVKYEYVYLNPPNGGKELYDGMQEYMTFYNFERSHSAINMKKPAEVYFGKKTYFKSTTYSQLLV
ncbi:MAG: IS3 family transposase [Saprospiraceae bacterium]